VGVEVFELTGLDLGAADEVVHLALLQPDDATELVRGDLALVDQPVQRPGRDTQPTGGFLGAEPLDLAHAGSSCRCVTHCAT
jgi:hypothetical protein